VAVLVAATVTAPTAAVAGSSACPANNICIYNHADWVSLLARRAPFGGLWNVPSAINDKTSSWENKTLADAAWYVDANGQGRCRSMANRSEENFTWYDNDVLTSWRANGPC
jgi:hypothetical protein